MRQAITISLPVRVKRELDRVASEEDLTRSEVVREALRDYLFLRRFRALRRKMISRARAKGVFTDQDVFARVS